METFLDEINFQVIKERPLNGTMDCFALNKDQYYAIGYYHSVNLNKNVVAVYNKDNTFLYSLTFGGSGAFDIKWENDNLMILLYREDKIIAITTDGQLKSLYDTSEYKAQLPQTDFDGRINKIGKAKVFEQNGYSYRVSSTMVERTDPDGTSIIIYKSRSAFYQQMVAASHIPEFAEQIRAALPGISETALKGVNFSFLGLDLSATPNFRIWNLEAYDWAHIGLFLLPLFSALIQLLASLATQKLNNSVITNEKGERDKSADAVNNTAKSMLYVGPAMSLWIGFIMPAALSIYWIAQGVFSSLQEAVLTKIFRKGFDEEDAC